jgi:hypothetical protein
MGSFFLELGDIHKELYMDRVQDAYIAYRNLDTFQ